VILWNFNVLSSRGGTVFNVVSNPASLTAFLATGTVDEFLLIGEFYFYFSSSV
jgi:hypothetical protein